MIAPFEFHHFGIACRDLDREAKGLSAVGYRAERDDFVDARQGVRGRFLVGAGPRLELLVGLPGSSVLDPWLAHGSRIYHQAFEVDDFEGALEHLTEAAHGRLVREPTPATAFDGRRICFVVLPTMSMIELIDARG